MKKLIPIMAAIIFSCQRQPEYNFQSYLECSDTLIAEYLETELYTSPYPDVFLAGEYFITVSDLQKGFVQLLDKGTGKLISSTSNIGRGPDEMVSPRGQHYSQELNKLFVSDNYIKKIFEYSISNDSIELTSQISFPKNFFLKLIRSANDTMFVALNYYPNQSIYLLTNQWETVDSIQYRSYTDPSLDYEERYDNVYLDIVPEKKYIVVADHDMPLIKLYTYRDNKIVLLWEKMLAEPQYHAENGKRKLHNDQIKGIVSMSLTHDFIYLTFTGGTIADWDKSYSNSGTGPTNLYLVIFDYNGKHHKALYLKIPLDNIIATPDNKYLFGVNYNKNQILKYSLK
jgi:hypothetical protein